LGAQQDFVEFCRRGLSAATISQRLNIALNSLLAGRLK
jgi:hypothetical protein